MLRLSCPRADGPCGHRGGCDDQLLWLGAVGVHYVGLYLQDGFQVALLFGVVTVAIDLDRYLGLIAAHPAVYVAAILSLFSELYATLGNVFERPRSDRDLRRCDLTS